MRNRTGKWVAVALLALLAPSIIFEAKGKSDDASAARNLTVFNAIYKELVARYVDTVDVDAAITTAVNAMLAKQDPYTEYIPASDRDDFMAMSTTGEYGGIGSVIMQPKTGGSGHFPTLRRKSGRFGGFAPGRPYYHD